MDALWVYLDTGIFVLSEEVSHYFCERYSTFSLMTEVDRELKNLSKGRYFREVTQNWNCGYFGET